MMVVALMTKMAMFMTMTMMTMLVVVMNCMMLTRVMMVIHLPHAGWPAPQTKALKILRAKRLCA